MVTDKLTAPQNLPKRITWILVADRKLAQIYIRKGTDKNHMSAGKQQLVPAAPALYPQSSETYKKDNKTPGTQIEAREPFVKIIAQYLNKARAKRRFNRLVMIASAKLLGEIRAHLNKTTRMSIIAELAGDLTNCGNKELTPPWKI